MRKVFLTSFFILVVILFIFYVLLFNPFVPKKARINKSVNIENATMEQPQDMNSKNNLIVLDYPQPNQDIASPLQLSGRARGTWFFEASFPISLVDSDGMIVAQGHADALSEWMTEDFVPFSASLEFIKPSSKNKGVLILRKDNPSGLSEYDDFLEVPVLFK